MKSAQSQMRQFINQTGRQRRYDREQVGGTVDISAKQRYNAVSATKSPQSFLTHSAVQKALAPEIPDGLGKLPNAISAATTQEKIHGYLLNSNHAVGKNKAQVLNSVLDFHYQNWDLLSNKIYSAVQNAEATKSVKTSFGTKYTVPVRIVGEKGKSMVLSTVWQTDKGSSIPRLITATFNKKSIREEN